jgi:hypothetical protein
MCARAIGWLFDLAAQDTVELSAGGICIRPAKLNGWILHFTSKSGCLRTKEKGNSG